MDTLKLLTLNDDEHPIREIIGYILGVCTFLLSFALCYCYFFDYNDLINKFRLYKFIKNNDISKYKIDHSSDLIYKKWVIGDYSIFIWNDNKKEVSAFHNDICVICTFNSCLVSRVINYLIMKELNK